MFWELWFSINFLQQKIQEKIYSNNYKCITLLMLIFLFVFVNGCNSSNIHGQSFITLDFFET